MADGFRNFLNLAEEKGEVLRIGKALSPIHEIAAVMRKLDACSDKLLVFEKVCGYAVPVVWNLLGGSRIALAMGLESKADVTAEFYRRTEKLIPPRLLDRGPVLEVESAGTDVLEAIPVLTHFAGDVSPYFSSAVTIARDPATGRQSMGIHRLQVRGRGRLGILLNSPPLSDFWKKAQAAGRDMEIAIVVGIDPLTWLASVTYAPQGVDKYEIAGALRQDAVELVNCRKIDVSVPAEAEFLIEAKVLAGTWEVDGPFGESNGVYGTFNSPVVQVLSISHRNNPIYHALLPYTSEEARLMSVSWEPQLKRTLQARFPWVIATRLDEYDYGRLIIQAAKPSESAPRELLEHVLTTLPRIKTAIVVDRDIDIRNRRDVAFALATRLQPDKDVLIRSGLQAYPLDPSAAATGEGFRGSKMGLDATMPLTNNAGYAKTRMPEQVEQKIERLLKSYA